MTTETHARSLNGHPLTTMRGPLDTGGFPYGLSVALEKYDVLRQRHGYEPADALLSCQDGRPEFGPELRRLLRGMKRLTYRGVRQITARDGHLCAGYTLQNLDKFTTLSGLFYWNDGCGAIRRKLLLLAWRKGGGRRSLVPRMPEGCAASEANSRL